jgi:tetratricopeptide (TPR) repeat protein
VAFAVKNNYDKALADLAQAAAINPDDGMTFNIRGNVYLQMDNTDKARMDFETALTSKQPCAKAMEPLCDICFSAHKHAEALPYLEHMISADPGNISLVNRRAVVYMYAGEAAKALEGFDRVLSQTPNDPDAPFQYGAVPGKARGYGRGNKELRGGRALWFPANGTIRVCEETGGGTTAMKRPIKSPTSSRSPSTLLLGKEKGQRGFSNEIVGAVHEPPVLK